MADEEKNETTEETPEETPAAEGGEETPEEVEAPAGDGDEGASDDAGAAPEDASSGGDAGDTEPAADADDALEGLDWKARKRLARSRESGEAGPQRTPEERATERDEGRKKAAKVRASYRAKQRKGRETGAGTPAAERESAGRKERRGTVVSSKADKTITVRIDVARRHPVYEKIVRQSNTLHAHDESNEAGEGDLVRIVETRPLSKTKRWRLVEVLEKAK